MKYRITSFANKVLIMCSFIFSTVEFVGTRNRVQGLAVIFDFNLLFCDVVIMKGDQGRLCVGKPALNDAKSLLIDKTMLGQGPLHCFSETKDCRVVMPEH